MSAWTLFAIYVVATGFLAWRGGRRSDGASGFAIGNGRMNPVMAGLTLGACLASSAMFVIMPGFVYAEGLPALIGFSLPLAAGLAVGLWGFAPRFQALGQGALTVPHWLGRRYESPALQKFFACLNVLQLAYLVLITVGCAYVMEQSLGLSYHLSCLFIVVFVFGYTAFGGTWAHAFTNSAQGLVMLVMALVVFGAGWEHWASGAVIETLAASGWTAPESRLFSSGAEVWLVPFGIGVALTTQPHLMTKALYVSGRRELGITIAVGMGCFLVFSLVLFAGVYARLDLAAALDQDQIMAVWLQTTLPWGPLSAMVSVAILAASMSTLDGLLVAISASVGNDLFSGSVHANRWVLAVLAGLTLALAWSPPTLVLILGQLGVYGLVAASIPPLMAGLFLKGPLSARRAAASSALALAVHFGLALGGFTPNPGVAALAGLLMGLPVALWQPSSRPQREVSRPLRVADA
jgi:SSS family solute:Na+ symporter/sodium/pantothenate symporter